MSWIISFLPDALILWISYILFSIGFCSYIASKLVKWIPVIDKYKLIAEIAGIIFLVIGSYIYGSYSTEMVWRNRVTEMEKKVEEAEIKSKEENVRIEQKVIVKTQIVRERGQDIVKYIDKEIVKYDTKFMPGGECEIPKEFVHAHNRAAEAPK